MKVNFWLNVVWSLFVVSLFFCGRGGVKWQFKEKVTLSQICNRIRLFNISCLFEPIQLQFFESNLTPLLICGKKKKIFYVQLENSGNGPDFSGVHELSFGEALYFLMVTMSTVGYGDIVCQTKVGRVFQLLFLGVGLVSFILLVLSLDCFFFRLTTKTTNPKEVSANPQKMPPLVFFFGSNFVGDKKYSFRIQLLGLLKGIES